MSCEIEDFIETHLCKIAHAFRAKVEKLTSLFRDRR